MSRDRSTLDWTTGLVWCVWAALTLAAIVLILALGANVPFWDEWFDLIPLYAGVRPLDLRTLWQPHNEHRVLLQRLILVPLGHATDYDFRAGMLLSVALLSTAGALLLRSARAVDGRLRLSDCALPLLLLHWGHYMTLLWSYQLQSVLMATLACALLVIVMRSADTPPPRAIAAFGAGLLSLPLCQAGGVALAPVLALWCAAVGMRDVRSPEAPARRRAWAALALAAAGIALAACAYLPTSRETRSDPVHLLWSSQELLSTAFGLTERRSQLLQLLLPAATAALMLGTGVLLLRVARTQPRERLRVIGLALFLLAFQGIALGIAWGRRDMLSNRYPVLAAPALCGVYLAWRRYGPGRSGTWVCAALCGALVLLAPWNTAAGLRFARNQARTAAKFERDVRAGVPIEELALRTAPGVRPKDDNLGKALRIMRDARIGVFRPQEGEAPND